LLELADILRGNGDESHLMSLLVTSGHLVSAGVTSGQSESPERPPDPTRERDTISSPTTSKINTAPDPGNGPTTDGLAALLRRLDWYGAKFTAGSTAAILAEKLIDTFPKVDHQQAAKEASAWLLANPTKRKKYVSRFLIGWFKNAGKPAPWEQTTAPGAGPAIADRRRRQEQAQRKRTQEQDRARANAIPRAELSRQAGEVADSLRRPGPMSTELETIADRVAAREGQDE